MLPRTQKARKEIRLSRVQFLWYWLSGQEEYEKSPQITDNGQTIINSTNYDIHKRKVKQILNIIIYIV